MHAFFELHGRNGPILKAEAMALSPMASVFMDPNYDHWQGCPWTATPMPMRKKRRLAMARYWDKADQIAITHAVGAAGHIDVFRTHAMSPRHRGEVDFLP
jgi:hypothetical protein